MSDPSVISSLLKRGLSACFSSYCLLSILSVAIHQVIKGNDLLLSLMQEMNNPGHSYQAYSHSRCKRKAFGVSWCFDCLPENEWCPDCSRLSYGIHDHQSKCSLIDIVLENIICPTAVSINFSRSPRPLSEQRKQKD